MYGNYYNPQNNLDRINAQINELEKLRAQIQQPVQPSINQTFQLTPSTNLIRYANSLDDVKKEYVVSDTPFFSKDLTVLWVKNTKGDIRSFELNEIIPKDSKDMQIELLQAQIEDLRKEMRNNEQFNSNDIKSKVEPNTSKYDEPIGDTIKETKSSSISRVSTSKKR